MSKRAVRLNGSDVVFKWTDGSTDRDVLERILQDALEQELDKSVPVILTREQRIKKFDPRDPQYEQIEYRKTVGYLLRMYKDMTGREFEMLSNERLQQKYRLR